MGSDLGRRIRALTATAPLTVDQVARRGGRSQRSWPVVAGAGSVAAIVVVAVLLAVRPPGGPSVGHLRVSTGQSPSACSSAVAVEPVTATSSGGASAPATDAPVLRTTAVVRAPMPSKAAKGRAQVTVGLNAGSDFGDEVSITRVAKTTGGLGYQATLSSGDDAVGGMETRPLGDLRPGDPIVIELAIRKADPDAADYGRSIAALVYDARALEIVRIGNTKLLAGRPRLPTSSREDVSTTETTWKQGWPEAEAGLADEATSQTPLGYDTFVGVTQKGSEFQITDEAHRRPPVAVATAGLHARAGDDVVVEATTPVLGTHTAVTVTDERTHDCVSSGG